MPESSYKEIHSESYVTISNEEFKRIRDYIYKNIGINLTEQKKALLMGRLQKLLRKYSFVNFEEYYNFVVQDKSGKALSELANSISTNHTFFYREYDHFEYFKDTALPEISRLMKARGENDIRVWSAGCSSGEEPYTLVMLMMEYFGKAYNELKAGVLATDISETALQKAMAGVYASERFGNMPKKYISRYFRKKGDNYEVTPEVKKEVTYRKFNLMVPRFPFKKQFDVIFCRNVMIYFDEPTRENLVSKFYDFTAPGGHLFIGHSETIKKSSTKYHYIKPAVYRKI
ncbi:MAG: CheR family methyltransferase [Candidatus Kapaibacterium sp.]